MRFLLTALLAFTTGVVLMLVIAERHATNNEPASTTMAGNATVPATTSSSNDADDNGGNGDNWPTQGPSPEQIIYAQPTMVRQAMAKLSPRIAGKPNLYLVAFAGDGGEDVFRNEAEYAAELFTKRFGHTAHALVLENNPSTLQTHPLADWSNLDDALSQLANIMRPEQDILVLYVTSHGDEDHNLLVDMDPLPLDQIGAPDLAAILKKHFFKWKVLVVNACYSGGFVPDLRGPGTLVLTAARTDRSSFGCGSASNITYFGKAWLVDALNKTDNFIDAFHLAKRDIGQWEQQDHLTPSDPQMDIGSGITQQLRLWRKGINSGPAVAFRPPPPSVDHASTTTQ